MYAASHQGDWCRRVNPNGVDLNRNWDEHWEVPASGVLHRDMLRPIVLLSRYFEFTGLCKCLYILLYFGM